MKRRKNVDERKRGLHTARQRPVLGTAQKRVQPYQSTRTLLQCRERSLELLRLSRVPAIAHDDYCSSPINNVRPAPGECAEAWPNESATGPTACLAQRLERALVRPVPQQPGYSRQ